MDSTIDQIVFKPEDFTMKKLKTTVFFSLTSITIERRFRQIFGLGGAFYHTNKNKTDTSLGESRCDVSVFLFLIESHKCLALTLK